METASSERDEQAREEEYVAAQRAGAEAVLVGRETLMTASQQSEQIAHADRMADHAQYALDKSARLLRGMTWSGWVTNMFSKDVEAPSFDGITAQRPNYEQVPESCQAAAQAVQNYHCNLMVLEECETDEQRSTCIVICDNMYDTAAKEIAKIRFGDDDIRQKLACSRLASDLSAMRDQQNAAAGKGDSGAPGKQAVKSPAQAPSLSVEDAATNKLKNQQDDHLNILSQNLGELKSIAWALGDNITEQNELLDSVDEKSDSIGDKTKLVTRRADRVIQRKTWRPTPKVFHAWISIQHVATKKFLGSSGGSLVLVDKFQPLVTVFGVWKRKGSLFGLQHRLTDRWLGQTFLGSLSCTASSFGSREEWEADDDWNQTWLLCASANWGNGGYLMTQRENSLYLGGSGIEAKKQADLWCLSEVQVEGS